MRVPPMALQVETQASVSSAVGCHALSGGGAATPDWQPWLPAMVAML